MDDLKKRVPEFPAQQRKHGEQIASELQHKESQGPAEVLRMMDDLKGVTLQAQVNCSHRVNGLTRLSTALTNGDNAR